MFIHKTTIKKVLPFLFPEITRGPAYQDWLDGLKSLGHDLDLQPCPHCEDAEGDLCVACRGTGYDWESLTG
jgi:hypothetical protein